MEKGFPHSVKLVEVGMRDGFQFEATVVPIERKVAVVKDLVAAGVKEIQVASFVHPAMVPQMADADSLIGRLPRYDDVAYTALVLNRRGLARAKASGIGAVEISLSASDTHSRKNAGMSHVDALEQALAMIDEAISARLFVRASLQCAFGCVYEGPMAISRIEAVIRRFVDHGAQVLALADTTGMGAPTQIKRVLDRVLPLSGGVPLALHLHDTRGLGLVNLMAALRRGVTIFDTALGGMGGCPFVAGAAGNIATEDTAHLLETLGIETGVDIGRVSRLSRELATFFEKSFSGRIYRLKAGKGPSIK